LKDEEYKEWSLMFKEANSTLVDREVIQYQVFMILIFYKLKELIFLSLSFSGS